MVVEPNFAKRDDVRMPRAGDQVGRRNVQFLVRIMRVCADRAIDIGKALGDRQHAGMAVDARRDRDHARNAGSASARDHGIDLRGKIRKIEMAMAVDQHGYCAAGASAST